MGREKGVVNGPVLLLMGPTASGKTGLAVELAERLCGEVVSVDSALVYRGLDIGTAKPDARERRGIPHHLIDICDPAQPYSAAAFREDALAAIGSIQRAGRLPILAGGTMLYFRALLQGLSPLPQADPALRERLDREALLHGWGSLHRRLDELDPVAAARIHPTDSQRIQRALEVIELTGERLSTAHAGRQEGVLPFRPHLIALLPQDRAELHRRIAQRFERMIEVGFVDEVRRLRERDDLHTGLPALRAVGYRQAWGYLDGEYDFTTFRDKALAATRQLARRQLTWLRAETAANSAIRQVDPWAPDAGVAIDGWLGGLAI